MNIFLGILVFIFGSIIGSFLNVVVLRYKTGRTLGGRSFCFSCGKTLTAFELVPVLSFAAALGKCRSCKTKISWQYPMVEALTGLVFVVIFFNTVSLPQLLFFFFAFSILIAISVYDLRHKIVPDMLAFIFALVSLAWLFTSHPSSYFSTMQGIMDILAGPILFLPFFALWYLSSGAWMGLGDGKLAVGIGWMLGLVKGVSAIILGFWSAALVALILLGAGKLLKNRPYSLSSKSEIPFAPFLVFGALLAFLYSPDLFNLNSLLFQ